MTIKRDPSKALQIGFLALLVISTATVAYWITENVIHTRDVREQIESLYRADARAVTAVYAGASASDLAGLFPHLETNRTTGRTSVRVSAISELVFEAAGRNNRHFWEGGFFLIVLISGMAILTRTIRHDTDLRRRQQNFLAAVSHEFKSPLASMQLAAETLVLRSKEPDSKRLGQRLLEDGGRLQRMVDNLLNTTRLEEGRHALAPEEISLHAAAQASITQITDRAERHQIHVNLNVPESLSVSMDRSAFDTILRNLLDNALKACIAGDGHSIAVNADQANDRVQLSVNDDGLGFAPEDAAMMFEKFYRLGDELRRSMPGTGLGLYIVKRLAELNDAQVSASSEGAGRGATVTITWQDHRVA